MGRINIINKWYIIVITVVCFRDNSPARIAKKSAGRPPKRRPTGKLINFEYIVIIDSPATTRVIRLASDFFDSFAGFEGE